MKYSELEKLLRKSGCTIHREGRNHTQWFSPKTGKVFPVGRQKTQEVPVGTLKSIKTDAEIE